LNTLFFIDLNRPEFNELQKAYYACYREFAALKILQARSAKRVALPLAEKLLKIAQRYEFTDLIVNVLRELRSLYVTTGAGLNIVKTCNALLHRHYEILQSEMLAEEYYFNLVVHYIKSSATKLELAEVSRQYALELDAHLKKCKTFRFIQLAYHVFSMRYQIVNDYPNTIRICEEAVDLLSRKKNFAPTTNIVHFLLFSIRCHIQLGNYLQGEQQLRRCFLLEESGSVNWFIAKEYHLLLMFHAEKYEVALQVLFESYSHKRFMSLGNIQLERWKLYEAFIHYLVACGTVKLSLKQEAELGKFKLNKFLNEVPEYSKDKMGANISILILQVLFLLQMKSYEEASDRLNALSQYSHRYLRKDETFRSNCFIHMLLQIPASYFNKKALERKAKKYVEKLAEMPLPKAKQSSELEPVPYEHLWKFAVASLKG
jgi:hypothetical protein